MLTTVSTPVPVWRTFVRPHSERNCNRQWGVIDHSHLSVRTRHLRYNLSNQLLSKMCCWNQINLVYWTLNNIHCNVVKKQYVAILVDFNWYWKFHFLRSTNSAFGKFNFRITFIQYVSPLHPLSICVYYFRFLFISSLLILIRNMQIWYGGEKMTSTWNNMQAVLISVLILYIIPFENSLHFPQPFC